MGGGVVSGAIEGAEGDVGVKGEKEKGSNSVVGGDGGNDSNNSGDVAMGGVDEGVGGVEGAVVEGPPNPVL